MKIRAGVALVAGLIAFCAVDVAAQTAPSGTLQNFSLLVTVSAGGFSPPLGFVVTGSTTTFLVRAVGPSLAAFGVSNPAPQPELEFFDSKGRYIYFSQVVSLANPPNYALAMGAYGAFPSTSPYDDYQIVNIPPGAYTMRATDHTGGAILIEMYQGTAPASANIIPGVLSYPE